MLSPSLINQLKQTHPNVAEVFQTHQNDSLQDYAEMLFALPTRDIESELLRSFQDEWRAMGISEPDIGSGVAQIKKTPVLQTGQHITPTYGPTFLALDVLSCAGLRENQFYLVGANSGVAYSNTAWSGALSYDSIPIEKLLKSAHPNYKKTLRAAAERKSQGTPENRISLIPANQRDQLVYGSTVGPATVNQWELFSEKLQATIPSPEPGELYSYWAAKSCDAIQRKILNQKRLIIFDINRVIKRYLVQILTKERTHPVKQIFFDPSIREKIEALFQNPIMFLGSYRGKKSFKVDPLKWTKEGLSSSKAGVVAKTSEELIEGIDAGLYCPAVFLVFLILRFINGIRCLGSFKQLEYLEDFRQRWQQFNENWQLYLAPEKDSTLTTGKLEVNGKELWPLDLAFNNESIMKDKFLEMKMEQLWNPILKQLTNKQC